MIRYLKLLALFVRLSIQNEAAYRVDFFFRLFSSAAQLAGELLGLWTIFSNTRSLAGWNVYQVVVLLGVFRIVAGVIGLLVAPNMRKLMEEIRTGTLDFVLTKPVNAQFLASCRQVVIWRAADLIIGAGMAAVGAANLGGSMSPLNVLLFVFMLACGAVIIYSFWLVLATSVVWFTRIDNIEMVFWNVFEAGRYPIDIYRPWVRWALTFFLPLAFLITFPAGTLVGKSGGWQFAAALIVAPLTLALATRFFRFGMRHYSGASA
jgi:ABC-2 type transport system permease protein